MPKESNGIAKLQLRGGITLVPKQGKLEMMGPR